MALDEVHTSWFIDGDLRLGPVLLLCEMMHKILVDVLSDS